MNIHEYKIRTALKKNMLKNNKNQQDILLFDEFSLNQGQTRIDLAVFDKIFRGFEIKSDKDNLERLPIQVSIYNNIFEKMTLIVGYKNFSKAIEIIPDWWGVKLYEEKKMVSSTFRKQEKPN